MPILRPCLVLMLLLSLLTGVAYPLVVTVVTQTVLPAQANGSLLREGDAVVGSRLIGQPFAGPGWFRSRPSAVAWNAAGSGGANLAPVTGPQREAWAAQAETLRAEGVTGTIPADLVTASGSGLDPHLSPEAVLVQAERVARERGLDPQRVRQLINDHIEGPQLGLLGPPRINVLELNLALTKLEPGGH